MYSSPQMTASKIASTFAGISSDIESIIDDQKDKLEAIKQFEDAVSDFARNEYPHLIRERKRLKQQMMKPLFWKRLRLKRLVNKNQKIVDRMKTIENIPNKSNDISVEDVKHRPISNWLDCDKGNKRECIWCDDTSGDMHYYENDNRVYCFSCREGGDVVDVIQQLRGLDFKQALNFLS